MQGIHLSGPPQHWGYKGSIKLSFAMDAGVRIQFPMQQGPFALSPQPWWMVVNPGQHSDFTRRLASPCDEMHRPSLCVLLSVVLVCASVRGQRWEEISPTRVKTWKQSKGRGNSDLGSYAELGPSTWSSLLCHIILCLTLHDNLALFRCGLIHQPRTLHDPLQNTWPSAKCSEASVCFCENWSKTCPHENTCLVLSPWCK